MKYITYIYICMINHDNMHYICENIHHICEDRHSKWANIAHSGE
jgi:hypothetical protein